jgi:predicted phage terminase large subunit-like protein
VAGSTLTPPPPSPPLGWPVPGDSEFHRSLLAQRCRLSLYEFVKHAWEIIDPGVKFIENWHVKAICDHLQSVTHHKIKKLLINIPPGMAKSVLTCVFWPAWAWIDRPWLKWLFGSYDINLSLRDSERCRVLLESAWYRDTFRPEWRISKRQNAKGFYVNTAFGHRFAFGMNSRFKTGWRGDIVVVDDPLSADDRFSPVVKEQCAHTWKTSISTRVNDQANASWVIIMQRLSHDDLSGVVLEEGGWDHLRLPAEYEADRPCRTSIGWSDPRRKDGELLFEKLFPKHVLEYLRDKQLGYDDYEGQFQQNPSREGGGRFRKEFFQYWDYPDPSNLRIIRLNDRSGHSELVRIDLCPTYVYVDVAVSEKQTADYTVYLVCARTPKGRLVVWDRLKGRMTEPQSIEAAVNLYRFRRHGDIPHSYFAVEANGVGQALYQQMREKGLPVKEVFVHRDKISMSATAVVRVEAGDIYFPAPSLLLPWVADFEQTLTQFPLGSHDDDVTSISLAANDMFVSDLAELKETRPVEIARRAAREASGLPVVNGTGHRPLNGGVGPRGESGRGGLSR